MSHLILKNIHKAYGALQILKDVTLEVKKGEFVVFVGPSGCGKSTLLRSISGLETVESGDIVLDGRRLNDVNPARRGIAMVFQSYALYPHMTVYKNIAFGLEMRRTPKAEIKQRVQAVAERLQLTDYLQRHPRHLSGGQRQRVAIGRAIIRNPSIFLFDEPLSNLDAALRVQMRIEILKLKRHLPDTSMIYVTHDQVEAMTMADRIVILNGGVVEQIGTPLELYHHPVSQFVAGFIGSPRMNFFAPELLSQSGKSGLAGPKTWAAAGVRPEHLTLGRPGTGLLDGTLLLEEVLGHENFYHFELANGQTAVVRVRERQDHVRLGQKFGLSFQDAFVHYFDAEGLVVVPSPGRGRRPKARTAAASRPVRSTSARKRTRTPRP